MTAPFELHPRLAADTVPIGVLPLCRVLLMNDSTYPWCILVPARSAVREIHELDADDRALLIAEIAAISEILQQRFSAAKMNVAALGNVVPQLHVHVIARFEDDPAWPAPVWGRQPAVPYSPDALARLRARLHHAFEMIPGFLTNL